MGECFYCGAIGSCTCREQIRQQVETGPMHSRIQELEGLLANEKEHHAYWKDKVCCEDFERDRLAARVTELEQLLTGSQQKADMRKRALEKADEIMTRMEAERDRLRRALEDAHAALAWHSSQSPRAAAAVQRIDEALRRNEPVTNGRAASPSEHAALLRVAEAAEQQAERIPPVSYGRHGCGCESGGGTTDLEPGFTCGMHAAHDVLLDALAELRKARSEAHVDEVARLREEWDKGGEDGPG